MTFAAGATSAQVSVTVLGDTTAEPNETFTVTLSSPTGGLTLGSPSSATVTITNDDAAPPPSLTIADVYRGRGQHGHEDRDADGHAVGARRRRR